MPRTITRMLLISLAAGLLAGAEVYKWVDENGVVHYTDTPPESQQALQIDVSPPAEPVLPPEQAPTEEVGKSDAWYEQWLAEQRERKLREKQQREEKTSARAAEETEMLERCATARRRQETLEKACPVFFDGQGVLRVKCPYETAFVFKGDFRYLSDEERANMLQNYREQVEDCDAQGY
jgi:hypothetical protein